MTRRLVATLLVFTLLVLLATLVPLGVVLSGRDRADYAADTRSLAQSLAQIAADSFDEARRPLATTRLTSAAGSGSAVAVIDPSGTRLVQAGARIPVQSDELATALAGRTVSRYVADVVLAVAPVEVDNTVRGVVVVSRADEVLERRIARLWLVLALVATGALLLAVLLAVVAAGWVTRPLRRLRLTAHRWSEGGLHERARTDDGPPELREVATALNVMAERLDVLLHDSRAVVADVSHQLRTPLAAMRLRLELVRDELDRLAAEQVKDDVTLSLAEVERLSRLVDGLLAVARAESATSEPEPIDVSAIARERQQAWQPVAEERGVQLLLVGADQPLVATATPGMLEQVLDNLVDNALETLHGSGQVTLAVAEAGDVATVAVHDDGPGMTAAQQQAAFRRFVSGRSGEGTGNGTGLGLAVVHRLVTADGGQVSLDSVPGRGTSVTVRLPCARSSGFTRDVRRRRSP